MKKRNVYQKRHRRKKLDFHFPHVRIAFLIAMLAVIALVISWYINKLGFSFLSSIFSNIFAGLVTGLILCVISGSKQRTIAELKSKLTFLDGLQTELKEYLELHHELVNTQIQYNANTSDELFNFIYDVGSHANWVNSYICQSTFNRILAFEPCEYCKKRFEYDAIALSSAYEELHDFLTLVDINHPSKNEILDHFNCVDMPLKKLNCSVIKEIDAIKIELEAMEHSLF